MKRIFTLLGIIATTCLLGNSARAQTITSANYIDSCGFSGSNTVNAIVQLSSPTSLTSCLVESNFGDGTAPTTTAIYSTGTPTGYQSFGWGHSYAATGTYTIKHVLICGGNRIDSLSQSFTLACNFIGGALYHDANSDCAFNATEGYTNGLSSIEIDSSGVKVDTIYAWSNWWYRVHATTSTVYKFRLLSAPTGFTLSCPSSGIITHTYIPSGTAVTGKDFGFNCSATPSYDYSLTYSRALRGASSPGASFINLYAANTSCHTGTSTVTLNVSPKYNITSSGITPTPASVSGNTVVWSLSGLSSGYRLLHVPLTPKSTTSNGDTACNYAIITPTIGDPNVANNVVSVCDSVRASWDPNEKSVYPAGLVNAGTTLYYTIDFENLGNDTAFNIHVQDTLSQHLDPNSFALLGSTHRVTPYLYQIAGGVNILKFDFAGINLEDKSVPERNKGQVRFSINMKSTVPNGTVVQNRAGIYFDGNPVVLTNYAYSTVPSPARVPGINQNDGVRMFPNPVNDILHIQVTSAGWEEALLSNALGQVVLQQSVVKGANMLNTASLTPGIYYLQLKGSAGIYCERIEKQ